MDSIRYIIENLYTKFFLRDVFGKIVPGLTIIVSIMAMIYSKSPLHTIETITGTWTVGILLLVLGASWILGFAAQELLRVLHMSRVDTPIGRLINVWSEPLRLDT